MRFFGIRFTAKKEPRYPSYAQFEELSAIVQSVSDGLVDLNKAIEATRKKVYRTEQKGEIDEIMGGDGKLPKQKVPILPGSVLSSEQVRELLGG